MDYSFIFKAKEKFLHTYYDKDIEMISVGSQVLKCDAIKIIRKINNCNLNEILFVDDIKENIIRFNNIGINAILIDDVDLLMIGK